MNKRLLLWFLFGIVISKLTFYVAITANNLKQAEIVNAFTNIFSMPYSWIFINIMVMIAVLAINIIRGSFIKGQEYWLILSMVLGNLISIAVLLIVGHMISASL